MIPMSISSTPVRRRREATRHTVSLSTKASEDKPMTSDNRTRKQRMRNRA
jgi:hypothetical protein